MPSGVRTEGLSERASTAVYTMSLVYLAIAHTIITAAAAAAAADAAVLNAAPSSSSPHCIAVQVQRT